MNRYRQILVPVIFVLIFLGLMVWLLISRSSQNPPSITDSGRVNVVASFYPIAEFARNVGGDFVNVSTVTPAGAEPHDYEPTSEQIASAYDAKVFLYNGGGVDAWAERIAPDVAKQGVTVAEMGTSIDVVAPETDDAGQAESTSFDPHFWLDPPLAMKEVDAIRGAFIKADPSHASTYTANALAYHEKLSALAQDYFTGLKTCSTRTIVTSHAAFAYLANDYHLDIIAIAGISPEEEPSTGRMAQIVDLAKKDNIKYIYFETLVSPKLSQTIADEIGAQTLVFNPLEGLTDADIAAGKNYISVMEDNLKNLETGMSCR